jgi:hypothetical protein
MSNGRQRDWNNRQDKHDAILAVLRYIVNNPQAGQRCVGRGRPPFREDVEAHRLFEDPNIGNMNIPNDGRVVIFNSGEEALEPASSIIIELPPIPAPPPPRFSGAWSDEELMTFVLGNYRYW